MGTESEAKTRIQSLVEHLEALTVEVQSQIVGFGFSSKGVVRKDVSILFSAAGATSQPPHTDEHPGVIRQQGKDCVVVLSITISLCICALLYMPALSARFLST